MGVCESKSIEKKVTCCVRSILPEFKLEASFKDGRPRLVFEFNDEDDMKYMEDFIIKDKKFNNR